MSEEHLFGGLPEAELRRVISVARRRRFGRNEIVFHRGDPADTLHLISRGRFASRMTTQFGESMTVAVQGPGDAFGELALVEPDASRSTTVVALEPGETFAVSREEFTGLRDRYPRVNDVLVRLLAQKLRRQSELLVEALFVPADARVLRRICELALLYGGEIPLTQEDIAGLAGTSRATVNRVLRAESKRGSVQVRRGRTSVIDAHSLAKRSGAA
jgi:CRP/FNR family transcriptional regulator, cyclic AMP receptor protein